MMMIQSNVCSHWKLIDDTGYDPSDIRGDDEVELTDEEFSDSKDEVAEVFQIDTNLFDFEMPIWKMMDTVTGGNVPGNYIVGNSPHYQDYKWYDELMDCELKKQALNEEYVAVKEDEYDDLARTNNDACRAGNLSHDGRRMDGN
ncbi:hypothetical protein Tco_1407553 [Tanacetum coccineum]|uniref:Uncharacterized protein n=1 Tax=Tanacetum coccineum TaxID=301880 RepID=A0ABQ5H535_9ASTR